jgi:hypothetical protein
MAFDKDLFISYAHIDNQPLMPGQQGWVERFHFSLAAFLNMRMGGTAKIWRDERLASDDIFADEIVAQFPGTAVMLSVLSPRYVESKWCTREIQEFCDAAEKSVGLRVANKSRLVKVLKAPVDREHLPHPAMRETLGYQFYELDHDHIPQEFDPYFGEELGQKFLSTVNKLAFELSELLKLLAKAENGHHPTVESTAAPAKEMPAVYLAECSYDQRAAREMLDCELKRHGYRVLPDHELPKDEEAYIAEVTANLEQSQLSIHLIGNGYGAVLDGPSQKSLVVLQNELAIQRSHEGGLRRMIWIPDGLAPKQAEQIQFIDQLKRSPEAQFAADVITSPETETIKGAIHNTLQKMQEPAPPADAQDSGEDRKLIYLICDQRDRMNTISLRKLLKAAGYDVEIPIFEGDAATVRQANQNLMMQCSAIVVFYGEGGELWKLSVDGELRKNPGSRNGKRPIFTYLAGPETEAKRYLVESEEANLLNCLPGFSEPAVHPFLQALEGTRP